MLRNATSVGRELVNRSEIYPEADRRTGGGGRSSCLDSLRPHLHHQVPWVVAIDATRSGLNHLFVGVKEISLEVKVDGHGLRRIRSGLVLFGRRSAFSLLLIGGGQQLLGFWTKTLWYKQDMFFFFLNQSFFIYFQFS